MSHVKVYQDKHREEIIFALRETLAAKGLNFSSFARKHGFDPRSVNFVAWRYWGRDKLPRGIITRRILLALIEEIQPPNGDDPRLMC